MVYAWENDFNNLKNDPFVFQDPVLGMEEGDVCANIAFFHPKTLFLGWKKAMLAQTLS
jgi:hypothetical protein